MVGLALARTFSSVISQMKINFGSYTVDSSWNIVSGTKRDDQMIIGDEAWEFIDIYDEYIEINGGDGNDQIVINPPQNGSFEYYGGPPRIFDVNGDAGNDTFVINSSSGRHFRGEIWGMGGIDVIEKDIAGDLRNWRIDPWKNADSIRPMVHLTNWSQGSFLDIDSSTEAIGSGNDWFLTKDMLRNTLEAKSFQSVIDDQIITSTYKSKDFLEGGAGSDEFLFYGGRRHIGKKFADIITDFNAYEGDDLSFMSMRFARLSRSKTPKVGYAERKKDLKLLGEEGYDFIYFQSKGKLYYDANGLESGLGSKDDSGGLVAKLLGSPELDPSHFFVH